ncbi:MAG: HAMP domain-containing sensor histidine kinase [Flavobacteriaceae bacterium]|nr:HAMP domain-containing sensor histidine kinase [Flavobacteriaceae bacterium]
MNRYLKKIFKNPDILLLVAIFTSALILVIVGIHTYSVVDKVLKNAEHSNSIRGKVENIRFLDEVLIHSAILAASTGDIKWEKRYLLFEPKLDSAIYELTSMDPEHSLHQIMNMTAIANIQLVKMEHRILELSHLKRQNEALEIITSSDYERQKAIFSKGLNTFIKNHEHETDLKQIQLSNEVNQNRWLFGLVILILAISWVPIAHFIRKNRQQVFNYSKELEFQIQEKNNSEIKLKEANKQIEQSNIELLKLNAEKDKFFSIIAHDLKSPFNSIIGFSELLIIKVQKKEMEAIEKYANIIQLSSMRAMDLLINLMDWARSQTGRMEFNPLNLDISILIDEIVLLLNDAALQKSITIHKNLVKQTIIYADKDMISMVLRNLISNAIKFTNIGGIITITTVESSNELLVSVGDNGVGIPKSSIEKLFRIDENFSTSGTQNEKGTGLGLILCKEFVEKHSGKLTVNSEIGKGSVFSFTIPLCNSSTKSELI